MREEEIVKAVSNFLSKDDPVDMSEQLIVRAVNFNKKQEKLKDGCFVMVTRDIALAAYAVLSDVGVFMTMDISKKLREKMGFSSEKELIDFAIKNTSRRYPALVYDPDNLNDLETPLLEAEFSSVPDRLMISCSNSNPNGATALFYPGVPEKLGEIMGPFAAVCLNTMDVMIFKPGDPQIKAYRQLASTENEYGEVLSGKVMYFDSEGVLLRC